MKFHSITKKYSLPVFLLSYVVSHLGDAVSSFAIILLAAESGIGWHVPATYFAALLSPIAVAPIANRFIDKYNPRSIWRITLIFEASCFLVMPILSEAFNYLLVLIFIANALASVSGTAAFKVLPAYSGKDKLPRATSVVISVNSLMGVIAMPIAAFIFGAVGIKILFIINAVSFLAVLLILTLDKPQFREFLEYTAKYSDEAITNHSDDENAGEKAVNRKNERVKDSVAKVLKSNVIRMVLPAVVFVILATSIEGVNSVFYLRAVADDNNIIYGAILAVWMLGVLIGSQVIAAKRYNNIAPVWLVIVGGLIMGVSFIVEGAVPSVIIISVFFLFGGIANGIHNYGMRMAIYNDVDREYQGRAWVYFGVVMNACVALGYVTGIPNDFFTPQMAIEFSGILTTAGCTALIFVKRFYKPRRNKSHLQHAHS